MKPETKQKIEKIYSGVLEFADRRSFRVVRSSQEYESNGKKHFYRSFETTLGDYPHSKQHLWQEEVLKRLQDSGLEKVRGEGLKIDDCNDFDNTSLKIESPELWLNIFYYREKLFFRKIKGELWGFL